MIVNGTFNRILHFLFIIVPEMKIYDRSQLMKLGSLPIKFGMNYYGVKKNVTLVLYAIFKMIIDCFPFMFFYIDEGIVEIPQIILIFFLAIIFEK